MSTHKKTKMYTRIWLFLALMMLFNLGLSGCSYSDAPGKGTVVSGEGTQAQNTDETDLGGRGPFVGGTVEDDAKRVEIDDTVIFPETLPKFGRAQWERWLETIEQKGAQVAGEHTYWESDLVVTVKNEVETIGQPIDPDNEEQLAAAELLFRAVLRYVGGTHLNAQGAIDGALNVQIYLTESTYDLDDLEGEVLLQLDGENSAPIRLAIVYEGSCRDQVSDYRVFGYETSQPFYEVTDALLLKSVITTENTISWMYEVWEALKVPDELNEEVGEFMDSETDPTTGELIYPARDYDGDGETDRFFKHANLGLYLMLSGGTVTTVDWEYTHLSDSRVVSYDLTGDGVAELIYLCRGRNGQTVGIWECVENEMRQIPISTACGEEKAGVSEATLSVMGEKVDEHHAWLTQPDSKKAYLFASESMAFDMTYGYGVKEMEVSCHEIAIENDAETGQTVLQMSGSLYSHCTIDLSWKMRYEDGKMVADDVVLTAWSLPVEGDPTQIEPVEIRENVELSDPVREAEAAGIKLEQELWLELLEQDLIRFEEERFWTDELMETGKGSYSRIFCVPWSPAKTVEQKLTEVVQWDPLANGGDPSELLEESNLVIHALVEARMSEEYRSNRGSSESEKQCAASEKLIGTALRYAGERYVEEAFAGDTWKVKLQLLESGFKPESMQGVLVIRQDGLDPLVIEVRCQGAGADAEYSVSEIDLPEGSGAQAVVLTVDVSIDTKSAMHWKYGVWDAFTHYEKEDVCQIMYGELYAAEDCDGDGLMDRGFRYVENEDHAEFYWVMGSGKIVYVSERGSVMQESMSVYAYDLTGDGVKEIICSKLRQQEGNYLQIFQWTEDGLQVMPFCYASGEQEDTGGMYKIDLDVVLQKIDDTHLRISQEQCQKTIELTVDPKLMSVYGTETPTVCRMISDHTYFRESDSGYVLVASGYIGGRTSSYSVEVTWEMTYEDGVWKVTDISAK